MTALFYLTLTLIGSFSVVAVLLAPKEMRGSRLENIFFMLESLLFKKLL